jgi:hypothetical protein
VTTTISNDTTYLKLNKSGSITPPDMDQLKYIQIHANHEMECIRRGKCNR